jgi:exopolysaccharide biosynthesis polyprenyl glycosylphosphotransferase
MTICPVDGMPAQDAHSTSSALPRGEQCLRITEDPGSARNAQPRHVEAAFPPLQYGVRFATGPVWGSQFLFSSGIAWAALDFVFACTIASLVQVTNWPHDPALVRLAQPHLIFASLLSGVPFALFALVCCRLSGLHKLNHSRTRALEMRLVAQSVIFAALALCGFQTLCKVAVQSPQELALESFLVGVTMFFSRVLWQWYRSSVSCDVVRRNFLIAGANEVGREVRDYLTSLQYAGYRFKGFISLCERPDEETGCGKEEIVGDIRDLITVARSLFVEEIVFTRRPFTSGVLTQVLQQARSTGIDIRLIPSLSETLKNRTDVQYIGNLPTIAIFQVRHRKLSLLLKRTIDIVGAVLTGAILLPVFPAIAIAIKLQSPGPVLYQSERVGYKGRVFKCLKFRTMTENAAAMQAQIAHLNERSGILFKIAKDPRITAVGAILRKYSLDELPQLWNVLRGDMSLVGPRPSIRSEVAQYKTAHLRRLDVVPGITGLWQVEGRQDPSFESYIALDSKYVNDWSLWLDLKILWRTIDAVITGTGV